MKTLRDAEMSVRKLPADVFYGVDKVWQSPRQISTMDTTQLIGWKLVGWTYSCELGGKVIDKYAGLFEDETGYRVWHHLAEATFYALAQRSKEAAHA